MKMGILRSFPSSPIQTQFAVRLTGFNRYSETNIDLFRAGNLQSFSEKTNDRKTDDPVFPGKAYVLDCRAVRSFHLSDNVYPFEIRGVNCGNSPDHEFWRSEPDKYFVDPVDLPLNHGFLSLGQFFFILFISFFVV